MKEVGKEILDWIKTFVIVLGVVIVVQHFILSVAKVNGNSMYPTLHHMDSVLLWKLGYEPERFDVVVFEQAEDLYYVKRVIGVPGETVSYEDETLWIDGEAVAEPFLADSRVEERETTAFELEDICQFERCDIIPEGYYLVLGDHRSNSEDSRHIGLISESKILGKAMFISGPFERIGQLE